MPISSAIPLDSGLPAHTSSPSDFDFLEGKWLIQNRKLKTRLANSHDWVEFGARGEMHKILNGFGNIDHFLTTQGHELFEGMALQLFNPQTRLWSIHWADSSKVCLDAPIVGSFQDNIGLFYGDDTYEGEPIIIKFEWDKTDPDKPVWKQAFSANGGQTWEWNWYMYFQRLE